MKKMIAFVLGTVLLITGALAILVSHESRINTFEITAASGNPAKLKEEFDINKDGIISDDEIFINSQPPVVDIQRDEIVYKAPYIETANPVWAFLTVKVPKINKAEIEYSGLTQPTVFSENKKVVVTGYAIQDASGNNCSDVWNSYVNENDYERLFGDEADDNKIELFELGCLSDDFLPGVHADGTYRWVTLITYQTSDYSCYVYGYSVMLTGQTDMLFNAIRLNPELYQNFISDENLKYKTVESDDSTSCLVQFHTSNEKDIYNGVDVGYIYFNPDCGSYLMDFESLLTELGSYNMLFGLSNDYTVTFKNVDSSSLIITTGTKVEIKNPDNQLVQIFFIVLPGDVNLDGFVDVSDSAEMNELAECNGNLDNFTLYGSFEDAYQPFYNENEKEYFQKALLLAADVSGNGEITNLDVLLIKHYYSYMVSMQWVEEIKKIQYITNYSDYQITHSPVAYVYYVSETHGSRVTSIDVGQTYTGSQILNLFNYRYALLHDILCNTIYWYDIQAGDEFEVIAVYP